MKWDCFIPLCGIGVFSSVRTIVQLTIIYFLHELPVNGRISWSFQTGKFNYAEHILWLEFWLDKSSIDMKCFFFYLVPLKMSGSTPWQRNNGRLLTVLFVANLREVAILCHTQQRMSILVKSQTVTDCSIVGSSQFSICIGINLLFLPAEKKWK